MRYSGIARGAVVMTGNTFGLDKTSSSSTSSDPMNPGNLGSQGVFLTVSNSGIYPSNWASIYTANQTPSPVGIIRSSQVSSTNRIGSSAKLYIPSTAKEILHAELVWFANLYTGVNGDKTVTFIHPDPNRSGSVLAESIDSMKFAVSYNLDSTEINPSWRIYVRSADVTDYIMKGENTYTVDGISASITGGTEEANCSGWCLMAAYADDTMDYNNMSMYVIAAPVSGASGFQVTEIEIPNIVTPSSGTLKGKAVIAAAEGDIRYTGDYVTFGKNKNPTIRLSAGNHTTTNFFIGEVSIADNDPDIGGTSTMGAPDRRGSMGNNNHNMTNTIVGARHGLDVTRVDISNTLSYGQTSAYMDFTTTGDVYIPVAFGCQVKVNPSLTKTVDRAVGDIGDILTYTTTVINGGSTVAWTNAYFYDKLQPGMEFVTGSVEVYYNGVLQSGFANKNPVSGFALKAQIIRTDVIVIKFKARIIDYAKIVNALILNVANIEYTLTDSAGNVFRITETSNEARTEVQYGEIVLRKGNEPNGLVTCTNQVLYTIQMENIGSVNVIIAPGAFRDPCPNGSRYVGEATSRSNSTGYDRTSIAFNTERTVVTNVKQLVISPREIITINFNVTPIC